MEDLGIYLHLPFCQHRCGYCDFNTYSGINFLIPKYINALKQEILLFAASNSEWKNIQVRSIYFGGGTPSIIPSSSIGDLMNMIKDLFPVTKDCEITLEANPGSMEKLDLERLFDLGVNRLSIGVQSTNQDELTLLERHHGYHEVCQAFKNAREVGFRTISADLIFGLPNQRMEDWNRSLSDVLELNPEHISLYALTLEKGTPLENRVARGLVPVPDPDLAAEMYAIARDRLGKSDFLHYEISNWAIRDQFGVPLVSRHNRQYWLNQPYLGFGAGAHSFLGGFRFENIKNPVHYIDRIQQEKASNYPFTLSTAYQTEIDVIREMEETMMMGLRLLQEGVSLKRFQKRFGRDFRVVFSKELEKLMAMRLIQWKGNKNNKRLVLTPNAYFVANQAFLEFISV